MDFLKERPFRPTQLTRLPATELQLSRARFCVFPALLSLFEITMCRRPKCRQVAGKPGRARWDVRRPLASPFFSTSSACAHHVTQDAFRTSLSERTRNTL